MKVLLTGGSGKLGTELRKLREYEHVPAHTELDITDPKSVEDYFDFLDNSTGSRQSPDLIVHCAAFTNVAAAEKFQNPCWDVNVDGTENLSKTGIPLLYISTEYVFPGDKGLYTEDDYPLPLNFYAMSKLAGEWRLKQADKILRLIFKPNPWPFPMAFCDQWTSGDYTDVMAKEVDKAIGIFDKLPRITNIGTGRKTMYELAIQTRQVMPNSRADVGVRLPKDCSLDITLWNRLKLENSL